MANRDILAIGTSAGGIEALRHLARELPADLPAAVVVVIHLAGGFESSLDAILTQAGPMPARFASDGEPMERGHIYLAPAETHLLVDADHLSLGRGPRENHARPAVDPLFRSAGLCCGPRAVGVVLTGTLGDGASGLQALKQCGGITVVQDPDEAAFRGMPEAALARTKPDHVVGLRAMPALLEKLMNRPVGAPVPVPDTIKYEVEVARKGHSSMSDLDGLGRRSVFTCPDCHGVMWEIDDGDLVRYRCHTGHAFAAEVLNVALDDSFKRGLASALRALEERIALMRRLKGQADHDGHRRLAESWAHRLRDAENEAHVVRSSIRRIGELAARAA